MKLPRITFNYELAPTSWLSLLLVLLMPLCLVLPPYWGWENGPLENTQVVILATGLLLCYAAARHHAAAPHVAALWRWLMPTWLLAIGRELSWGRVFYPISFGSSGPQFISLQQLWYGPLIRPLVGIMILVTLFGLLRSRAWEFLQHTPLPVVDVAVFLLMVGASYYFDKHTLALFQQHEEVLEEWAEVALYWSMVSIVVRTGFSTAVESLGIPPKHCHLPH